MIMNVLIAVNYVLTISGSLGVSVIMLRRIL